MRLYWFIPFIILFVFIVFIWNIPAGKFSETLPVSITISNPGQIGVHTTGEPQKIFSFGTTFPGTKVQKTMNLTRGNEPPAMIKISISGAIENWTTVDKNDFVLDDFTQVEIFIAVPENAGKGTYNGSVTIDYVSTYGLRAMQAIRKIGMSGNYTKI